MRDLGRVKNGVFSWCSRVAGPSRAPAGSCPAEAPKVMSPVKHDSSSRPRRSRARAAAAARRCLTAATAITVLVLSTAGAAYAAPGAGVLAAASIATVIHNIQTWLTGILAAAATLFLVIGGVRYLAAGGDPSEIERAKQALRSAALGYALAVLAPVLVQLIGQWVGA